MSKPLEWSHFRSLPAPPRGPAVNIALLLVEDNPGDARLIREYLGEIPDLRVDSTLAASLAEAEAKFREGARFDLALLDLHLPDGEGPDCLTRLVDLAPGLPVVVLTGSDNHDSRRYIELGAQDYLSKDRTDPELLARTIHHALSRAEIHRRLREQTEMLEQLRTQLAEKVEQRNQDLDRLHRAHRALAAANHAVLRATSEPELIAEVCRVVAEKGGYPLVWLGVPVDAPGKPVAVAASAGPEAQFIHQVQVSWDEGSPLGRGAVGTALREGRSVVIQDTATHPAFGPWREAVMAAGFPSVAAIPLFGDEGEVWAALAIYSRAPAAFDREELNLLKELAADLAYGVRALRLRVQHDAAQRALAAREALLDQVVETAPSLIALWHPDGGVPLFNRTCEEATGYRSEEIRKENLIDLLFAEESRGTARDVARKLLAGGGHGRGEFRIISKSGETRRLDLNCTSMESTGGERLILSVGEDVTERRTQERRLRQLTGAIEAAAETVVITDRDGVIEYVNPAFERLTGYSAAEAVGRTPALLRSGRHDDAFYRELWTTLLRGEPFRALFANRNREGEIFYEEKSINPLQDASGRITHFIATGRDVTEERRAAERLEHLSRHDPLTGLPNRTQFTDRLQQLSARWEREFAVLFLDLDRFKVVNETLGHSAGDALIRSVARRLSERVRDEDTAARLGGDEFAILLPDYESREAITQFARRILDAFDAPFTVNGEELYVTASVGIACTRADGREAESLLGRAEAAMYQAKKLGKNRHQFFTEEIPAPTVARLNLETALRKALDREEFVLHYQPLIDIHSGEVQAVEALIRWQHPERGLVPPGEFVPLLEETGLIVPAGEWVLRHAARQQVDWCRSGLPPVDMAVNLSVLQLHQENITNTLAEVIAESGIDPACLELEITESAVMHRIEEVVPLLKDFKAMGIRLSVDDFGTGYSSLSYLTRLPLDTLKVDRAFVRDIPDSTQHAEVTQAVVALAHALRLTVVAEGIENEHQLGFLRSIGCHRGQGYFFSRPVAADQIPALLERPLTG
ncbi:MAG: hypothetical protein Kow006_13250 [Gammaproteobacteria bacterium]